MVYLGPELHPVFNRDFPKFYSEDLSGATHIEQFNDYNANDATEVYKGIQARAFKYDQLHRIKKSFSFNADKVSDSGSHFDFVLDDHYNTNYDYDGNGNLQFLERYGLQENGEGAAMDQLTYHYANASKLNQLTRVTDAVTNPVWDNAQNVLPGQPDGNYKYDDIGNLVSDEQAVVQRLTGIYKER